MADMRCWPGSPRQQHICAACRRTHGRVEHELRQLAACAGVMGSDRLAGLLSHRPPAGSLEIPARHELKYFINFGEYAHLSRTLDYVLYRDQNGDEFNEYHIRSLYFDDEYNTAFADKLRGVQDRDKYRIRIYNFSDALIRLERKQKYGDGIAKQSIAISRELCEQLMAADPTGLEKSDQPLLRDVYRQMRTRGLKPAVIVDYVREAYVHPCEETRVTLDKQLRTGYLSTDLFDPQLPTYPCLDHNQTILEIKYNRRFPSYILPIVSSVPAQRSAISKYTLCRRYEFNL